MKCECCQTNDVEFEVIYETESDVYYLCGLCRLRLVNFAVRPLEFFNLAAIHGNTFYLHDDFYDYETREATQPKIEVTNADKFAFPDIEKIKTDLTTLVDFACVEYVTSEKVVKLLKQFDKKDILACLRSKVKYNRAINYKAYEIAAKVIGATAGEWIREQLNIRKENELFLFAEALSICLPVDEAFALLDAEIEACKDKDLAQNISALLYLQNAKTLDWIERHINRVKNVSDNWGGLAAASQFSWQRAEKWLAMGRPLSLIALDAVMFCTTPKGQRQNQSFWLQQHPPSLANSPESEVIIRTLKNYLAIDSVPRTRDTVKKITRNLST